MGFADRLRADPRTDWPELPGRVGFATWELDEREPVEVGANRIFHAASTIKALVLITALRQVADGRMALGAELPVPAACPGNRCGTACSRCCRKERGAGTRPGNCSARATTSASSVVAGSARWWRCSWTNSVTNVRPPPTAAVPRAISSRRSVRRSTGRSGEAPAARTSAAGEAAHRCREYTTSPPTRVKSTRASPMHSGGIVNGSRSSTTKSALLPTSTEPVSRSR